MLCENKLTNLVFKNQENSAKHNLLLFLHIYFIFIKKNTQNEMHEYYTMKIVETKRKTQKPKNNDYKGQGKEAQGPCQKDSISSSLLHPKSFKCTASIKVHIHIKVISNSRIGIKVESVYQFTNKCYRILCLWHRHFWFVYSLSSLQLVTVWMNVSILPSKMTNPSRLTMHLVLRKGRLLRFRLFQINPNLPRW